VLSCQSLVQFWCKQRAHNGNYAHKALCLEFIPPKKEQYAHNARYVLYAQECCITLTQKALVRPQDPHPKNELITL